MDLSTTLYYGRKRVEKRTQRYTEQLARAYIKDRATDRGLFRERQERFEMEISLFE